MKTRLFDIADVIRSKNAGPFELTFDIIFTDFDGYRKVVDSGQINKESFAKLYSIPVEHVVNVVNFDPAKAIKITILRPIPSGALGEADVYGAQQHSPLVALELDL